MTTTQPVRFHNDARRLTITETCVIVTDEKGWMQMTYPFDSPEQAHRAALAILTGPGKVEPDGTVTEHDLAEAAAYNLRAHVARLDDAAREAAEAAELDRRAELAYRVASTHLTTGAPKQWPDVTDKTKALWRDTIRALDADAEARRLHTNKETQHG